MRLPALLVLAAVTLPGCAPRPEPECRTTRAPDDEPQGVAAVHIELLAFPSCHYLPAIRGNLRSAVDSLGARWTISEVDQETLAGNDPRRGWPSPTILVNGRDLFGMPPAPARSAGCRMYEGGIPGADEIAERLRAWR